MCLVKKTISNFKLRNCEHEHLHYLFDVEKIVLLCYNIGNSGRKVFFVFITETQLMQNLDEYLLLSATEDIFITKNGRIISKLSTPFPDRVEVAKSLFGIIPSDIRMEEANEERLERI